MKWYLTVGSIRLAVFCLFFFFFYLAWNSPSRPSGRLQWIGWVWLSGSVSSLIHTIATMGWIHHWSYQAAWQATAIQSEELLGLKAGFGLHLNFLFVTIWIVDSIWMVTFQTGYYRRSSWWNWGIYSYLLFIAFNGAVVFASGWFRWYSAGLFAAALITWFLRFSRGRTGRYPPDASFSQ